MRIVGQFLLKGPAFIKSLIFNYLLLSLDDPLSDPVNHARRKTKKCRPPPSV